LTACSGATTGNIIQEKELRVGVILPLSGEDAAFGENILEGLTLAQFPEQIKFFIQDMGTSKQETVNAAKKLIYESNVDIILTTWDSDTLAIDSIPDGKQLPLVCIGCGGADITKNNSRLFSIWPSDDFEVDAVIQEFNSSSRAAVLQTINTWENALTKHFVENWQGEVLVKKAKREDKDMKSQLLAIKKFKPDVLYLPFYEQQYPLLFKQIRELNINASIATTSWINDPSILKNCGAYCEGAIVPQYSKSSLVFQEQFRTKYGKEAGIGADVGYDAYLLMRQIAGSNNLVQSLQQSSFQGASGKICFDKTGKRQEKDVDMYIIHNGELKKIK